MPYPSTRWSQVMLAGGASPTSRAALAWLCERYWECLRAHARRRGFSTEDAEDLTQDFLLSVIGGEVLGRADPLRGRFRTFLLACLDHHLLHARDRQAALKRGGGRAPALLDEQVHASSTPEPSAGFDRDWARQVVARARDQLEASEAPERWQALAPFLARNGDAAGYRAAGRTIALGEGAVKVAVHRLRERFRAALRDEVAQTLADQDPRLIDAEISHLLASLKETP